MIIVLVIVILLTIPVGYYASKIDFIENNPNSINPIYPFCDEWSVKDACMTYREGYYYIFASAFFESDERVRSHIFGVKTPNFKEFSEPLFLDYGKELGFIGLCSPQSGIRLNYE